MHITPNIFSITLPLCFTQVVSLIQSNFGMCRLMINPSNAMRTVMALEKSSARSVLRREACSAMHPTNVEIRRKGMQMIQCSATLASKIF